MAKPTRDPGIGKRMFSEATRMFETISAAAVELDCYYSTAWSWQMGACPSAYYVAKLAERGGDAMYVLTGRRGNDARDNFPW